MNRYSHHHQLIQFLQNELAVSEEAIALAIKHSELKHAETAAPLHMVLWQYGLVSLEQLGRIFDWLSDQAVKASTSLASPAFLDPTVRPPSPQVN